MDNNSSSTDIVDNSNVYQKSIVGKVIPLILGRPNIISMSMTNPKPFSIIQRDSHHASLMDISNHHATSGSMNFFDMFYASGMTPSVETQLMYSSIPK